jgi:Subtilase family
MNERTLKRGPTAPPVVVRALAAILLACPLAAAAPAAAEPPTPSTPSSAAASPAPPSPSEYTTGALCSPPTPGYSGCLGLRLFAHRPLAHPGARAVAPAAPAPSTHATTSTALVEGVPPGAAVERTTPVEGSLAPSDLIGAYGLRGATPPTAQTIALVDAYDAPTIASDLEAFSARFALPACSEANGCFRKVNQRGARSPLPPSGGAEERGWAQETATDVEVAHGVCPACRILLVEAESNANSSLYAAELTAASLGANEISNSWGGEEPSVENSAFDHPGVVITASAGDDGYLDWLSGEASSAAEYPASSPHVIAVGGTRLKLNASSRAWERETVWNDGGWRNGLPEGFGAGGGGCSASFAADPWQQGVADWSAVGCGSHRAVADVSADADPYTGVAVYDSTEYEGSRGWTMIGGTSVAAPIIASAFALAGGSHGVAYPAQTLYENERAAAATLHDVTVGSNGECRKRVSPETGEARCATEELARSCSGQAICLAGTGYDGPSGVGTPAGINALLPLSEHVGEVAGGGEAPGLSGISSSGSGSTGSTSSGTSPAPTSPAGATSTGSTAAQAPSLSATAGVSASPARVPVISALRLTRAARAATARRGARLSQLTFAFDASAATRVRVILAKLVRVNGRARWQTVTGPSTFPARRGAQTHRMRGRRTLASGRYRLELKVAGDSTRSLTFGVG